MESAEAIRVKAQSKLPDFLLAEYVHMCESFLRNEESGEKRAAFFVTLVGASGGILGFVFGDKTGLLSRDHVYLAAAVLALVLLCLGLLTVRRLIQRNIETDRIKFALRTLRRLFLTKTEAAALSNAFFAPYTKQTGRSVTWSSIGNGGWLETVAFVNALLTFVVIVAALLARSWNVAWPLQKTIALVLGLAVGVIVWIVQLKYAEETIAAKQKDLLETDLKDLG